MNLMIEKNVNASNQVSDSKFMTFLYLEISPILEVTATAFFTNHWSSVTKFSFKPSPDFQVTENSQKRSSREIPGGNVVAVEVDAVQLVGEAYRCPQERRMGCATLDSPRNDGEFCQPWLCLVVGTAGLLLKGPETPKLKRKWRMDGYFKKGEHCFQVLYINHHYDIMTMYWIQWAEKTFKHSCLMNGWRWLALVDFEVWPFPDRHSQRSGEG